MCKFICEHYTKTINMLSYNTLDDTKDWAVTTISLQGRYAMDVFAKILKRQTYGFAVHVSFVRFCLCFLCKHFVACLLVGIDRKYKVMAECGAVSIRCIKWSCTIVCIYCHHSMVAGFDSLATNKFINLACPYERPERVCSVMVR